MKLDYKIINHAFGLVSKFSKLYNIDESHAMRHSLDVFHNAVAIYNSEIYESPFLKYQQKEIFCSAILHDMCDKKYVDSSVVLKQINSYMSDYLNALEINTMNKIISTMSYSYVKANGFPDLYNFNLAYHIVREADLLAAYDIERCVIYQTTQKGYTYYDSLDKVAGLFHTRTFQYINDDLFKTTYSKQKAAQLHENALERIQVLTQTKHLCT